MSSQVWDLLGYYSFIIHLRWEAKGLKLATFKIFAFITKAHKLCYIICV